MKLNSTHAIPSNLLSALAQKKPFVFYRKPNDNIVTSIVQKDDAINYLTNFNSSGFVFAPFDSTLKTIFFPLESVTIHKFDYKERAEKDTTRIIESPTKFDKEKHISLVKSGIDYIKNYQTPKIVLSREEQLSFEKIDLVKIFIRLLNKYKTAFVYIWYHPKIGLWLGATPETLLEVKNTIFKTMALAGTQAFNGTLDVVWEEKERKEHQFVTDYIVNQLSKMNITNNVSETTTIKAGNLVHLQASISGRLQEKSQVADLIEALHPTPAVCGVPKAKAKEFILNNEKYNREFYTGFLGELNFETDKRQKKKNKRNIENHAYRFKEIKSSLFVNLRCMQVKDKTVHIYVGGGITKDSNPEKEYIETIAKAAVMKSIL